MTAVASRPGVSAGAGRSTDQIARMLARFISVGYLVYLAILLPDITGMAPHLDSWWTPLVTTMVFGSGVLLGVVSFRGDLRWVRRTAGAAAILFLVAVASWPVAWNSPRLDTLDGSWLSLFPGLAGLAAAIAWPAWLVFAYLVVACVGVQSLSVVIRVDVSASMLAVDILFAIMFCTLFVGAAAMALRTGRLLDTTTGQARAAAAQAAAERARAVERERFDALTHDNVMSTLLAASRGQPHAQVRSLSGTTLSKLDDIRAGTGSDEPFPIDRALAHLRAAVVDADERAAFDVHLVGDLDAVPADSVRALGSALAEAVRNVRLHAGAGARCTVTVTVPDHGIEIEVDDDGVGFDQAAVAPHRLGITVSILGRMTLLPGGVATIDSRPGAGTTVRLGWWRS